MKKVLKFAGAISLLLTIAAMILMMATPAVSYTVKAGSKEDTSFISGVVGIFGGTDAGYAAPWAGLIGWILVLVAVLLLVLGILIPIIKVKSLTKFAGLINICAVCCLVVAGVFMFLEKSAWVAANGDISFSLGGLASGTYGLGAGWVIGAILAIAAGVFAILPAAADFLSKK